MDRFDIRQDKPYRRGLVLGMTMAEIMVLLIFMLLLALSTALAVRERRLSAIEDGVGSLLIETMQAEYPDSSEPDDYYKELIRAIEARRQIERIGSGAARNQLVEDAELGRIARKAAEDAGVENPLAFAASSVENARLVGTEGFPPFISLREDEGYTFESGKATLRLGVEGRLQAEIIPLLIDLIERYPVNVVEVIGHTDEVPMQVQGSNIDQFLIPASNGQFSIERLRSTDNAGLAIARAVAVVRVLRGDSRLNNETILPLSGAQMIVPVDQAADDTGNEDDVLRRRIGIRVRQSTEQLETNEPAVGSN